MMATEGKKITGIDRCDVVLIRPRGERYRAEKQRPAAVGPYYDCYESLGMGYVAAALRKAGARVSIIDGTIDPWTTDEILERTLAANPVLVGFSILWEGYPDVQEFCRNLRAAGYQGHLTVGQHFATFNARRILADTPEMDSVVRFEGEETAVQVWEHVRSGKSLEGVPGIAYRNPAGAAVETPTRPLVHDLDVLPFPSRDVMERNLDRIHQVTISASRGCPWRCNYCSITTFYRIPQGKVIRHRSPKSVVDEMEQIVHKYNRRRFSFTDDQFMGAGQSGRDFARAFAREIIDRGLEVYFAFDTRADTIDRETFALLKRAGLWRVFMGIESGYQPTLDYFRKDITVEQNLKAVKILQSLDIGFTMGMIMFTERSSLSEVRANLAFLRETNEFGPQVFFQDLSIWSGTTFMEGQPGGDVADMYTRVYEIADAGVRQFRSRIQEMLQPLAGPYQNIVQHRNRGTLPVPLIQRCEQKLRDVTMSAAEDLLCLVEQQEATPAALADLTRRVEGGAVQIQLALDMAEMFSQGSFEKGSLPGSLMLGNDV
ncbi:MAG: radical SAM protein [Polyangiaceae bacterium]|nr:radical SAM protein [Polyangiaceae bacterium]